jgi:uncharacterized RDD family membrane protein YckC
MKNIEITTTQNVTIQYGLATVWMRGIAFVIDLAIIVIVSLILSTVQAWLIPNAFRITVYFTLFPFILLYNLVFEQLNNGQSLGKMMLRLRVIRIDGEKINFLDYFMRWTFRALDIYLSAGGVAILSILSSNNSQRIGDLLANTVVVNINKSERMRIESLLKLNKMDNYKVTYPQVSVLSEDSMLIVKEVLAKYTEHNNFAHEQALELLAEKMEEELKIQAPEDKMQFLRVLLKDYIVLTR